MWLSESNRMKHFLYAIPIGLIFTILCVLGVASGMEFKDREHGGSWDWLDWIATILGGAGWADCSSSNYCPVDCIEMY